MDKVIGLVGAFALSCGIALYLSDAFIASVVGISLWLTLSSIIFILDDIKKGG